MELSGRDVDEYLSSLPDEVRGDLVTLDGVIAGVMAGLPRELYVGRFWGGSDQEIIGYGRISYRRSDRTAVEWFMVGLARQKRYLSLYVSAVEDGRYLSETRGPDLGKVKVGKSSISFSHAGDVDLDALAALVTRARRLLEKPAT